MATAPLFTQIIGIMLMPVVTRLYTPEAFGGFSVFGAILMPICILATMGYSGSIVVSENDEIAANMLIVCLAFTGIITILTMLLCWFGSDLIFRWLKVAELKAYLWMLPVSVFLYGLQTSLLSWNLRKKRFGRISISKISLALSNKGILISAGFSGFATTGSLLLGGIAGSMTMSGVLGGKIRQESGQLFKRSIRWRYMVQGVKRHRKFPMYNLGTEFISRLASLMTVYLLTLYFSKSSVGYYGLGVAVLSVPATFIGSSIANVFYQKAAAAKSRDSQASDVESLFRRMTWMSMLLFLLIAVIGDNTFAFVFGVKWTEAGVYSQILSFSIFVSFVMSPAATLINVLEKQEVNLILSIVLTISSFISIMIGGLSHNIYLALALFSLFNGLASFGAGLFMIHCTGLPISRIFNILFRCFITCAPIIIALASAKWYFGVSFLSIIIISVIGCIIFYAKLLKDDKVLRSLVTSVFLNVMSYVKKIVR